MVRIIKNTLIWVHIINCTGLATQRTRARFMRELLLLAQGILGALRALTWAMVRGRLVGRTFGEGCHSF